MAPIDPANYASTTDWCLAKYSAVDCISIRNNAEKSATYWGTLFLTIEAIVCLSNIGLILCSLYLCYRILTPPVITQSMNDIMNFLLILPVIACGLVARYIW